MAHLRHLRSVCDQRVAAQSTVVLISNTFPNPPLEVRLPEVASNLASPSLRLLREGAAKVERLDLSRWLQSLAEGGWRSAFIQTWRVLCRTVKARLCCHFGGAAAAP